MSPERRDILERNMAEERFEAWRKLLGVPSTAARTRETLWTPLGEAVRLFCLNCGRSGGAVTRDVARDCVYICPPCAATHGGLPLPEVPPELIQED